MADLLGAIANPQMADIAGAIDYREKKLAADEAKRKEIRINQIMGKALSSGLREGSLMHQLALEQPQGYLTIAKHMGIDPSDGNGMHQMTVDVNTINKLAKTDPQSAVDYMIGEKDRRTKLGLNTDYLDKGLAAAQANPQQFFKAVEISDQTWNPGKPSEGFTLGEGQKRFDAQGNEIASIAPKAKNADDSESTANAKDLQTYKELLAKGDPSAEQFGQMIGMIPKENKKLSPFAEKEIGKASDEYTSAINSSNRFKSLAERLDKSAIEGGVRGTWGEWIKEQTGNQDELTALRKEALQIASSEAINNLPPGAASESDVRMAREPLPTEKADPKYVAKWLGAIGRLREKEAEYHQFKADFISKNDTLRSKEGKSLASAWKESQASAQEKRPPKSKYTIEVLP